MEYRLREVIQDACKFMRHSKRVQLFTSSVDSCTKKTLLRKIEKYEINPKDYY